MVRLGAKSEPATSELNYHFNSTMVRLGALGSCFQSSPLHRFQFHYGTIGGETLYLNSVKTSRISIPLWYDWGYREFKKLGISLNQFQFHYGTIGGLCTCDRLNADLLFQFHYGTIGGTFGLAPY